MIIIKKYAILLSLFIAFAGASMASGEPASLHFRKRGLSIELPSTWKGYRVIERRLASGRDHSSRVYFFSLKTGDERDSRGRAGNRRILALVVCPPDRWKEISANDSLGQYHIDPVLIQDDACYVFAWLREPDCPVDLRPRLREIPGIAKTLRVDGPAGDGDSLGLTRHSPRSHRLFYMLFRWALDR